MVDWRFIVVFASCLLAWGHVVAQVPAATAPSAAAIAAPLRLATGELPPYATAARADQGIALEIVRRAFGYAGYEVQYTFKPWTRSLEEARAGQWDGTAYWGRNPQRDVGFLISDNVLTEQWVFVYRENPSSPPFDWKDLRDLRGLRVGAVPSYTYTPEFWRLQKEGVLNVALAGDDLANLRLLLAGRLDVVPMERNVACYLMGAHFVPAEAAQLRAHPRWLTRQFTTHLMLSAKLPQSAARMRAFNQGLRILQGSHEYGDLLHLPGCSLSPRGR
nr:transporter substrate-binding domain-containing protein [uncultured Rhodoferax sp.]